MLTTAGFLAHRRVLNHPGFHVLRRIGERGRAEGDRAPAPETLGTVTSYHPLTPGTGPSRASRTCSLPRTSPRRIAGKLFGPGIWRRPSCDPSPSPRPGHDR